MMKVEWEIRPGQAAMLVVASREGVDGVRRERVVASVRDQKEAQRALGRLKRKYGSAGERLPEGMFTLAEAKGG